MLAPKNCNHPPMRNYAYTIDFDIPQETRLFVMCCQCGSILVDGKLLKASKPKKEKQK